MAASYGRSLASVRGNNGIPSFAPIVEQANSGAGYECSRPSRPRSDGVRCCDRRRRAGGPCGRDQLKQIAPDVSVVVVEKGSEVGAHILSGAVIDPIGLDRLIPEWRNDETPVRTPVSSDRFYVLGPSGAVRLPNFAMPPLMSNHGNFIVSLGDVCRYLAQKAEALGVEIYPGFAAAELLFEGDAVAGVATGDMGIGKDGQQKSGFTRGMELRAKYTLLAEGARGSLSKTLIARFGLAQDRQPQKYGIGLKELWQVTPENFQSGLVQHTIGWPLGNSVGGGSFLYHFGDHLVSVGFVVHLNYDNPYLSPFEEFQRFKTHPLVRDTFAGGKRIGYGARALTEGGWQSVPKLVFPGGALIGCAAGFINVPRIKGSHNAMLSGMLAAEHVAAALAAGRAHDELIGLRSGLALVADRARSLAGAQRQAAMVETRNHRWRRARRPRYVDQYASAFRSSARSATASRISPALKPAAQCRPIAYPKPDGKLTFDRLSSVLSVQHQSRRGSAGSPAWSPMPSCRNPPSMTSMPARRHAIARPASTNGSRRRANRATSSTRRIASTARPATSRIPTRTLTGCRRRAAAGRTIRICNRAAVPAGVEHQNCRDFASLAA